MNVNKVFNKIMESELDYTGDVFDDNDNRFRSGENIKPEIKGTPHFGVSRQKEPGSNPATDERDYEVDYQNSGSLTESAKRLHIVPHSRREHKLLFESLRKRNRSLREEFDFGDGQLDIRKAHEIYEEDEIDEVTGQPEELGRYLDRCSDVESWEMDEEVLIIDTTYNAHITLENTRN